MSRNQFQLEEGLEKKLRLVSAATRLREVVRSKGVDSDLRRTAQGLYSNLYSAGLTDIHPNLFREEQRDTVQGLIENGEEKAYDKLEADIDYDTYNAARGFYLGGLKDNFKARFYAEMIKEGMIPNALADIASDAEKENYKALKKVEAQARFVRSLEDAISEGNFDKATEIADRFIPGNDLDTLSMIGASLSNPAKITKAKIYSDFAQVKMAELIDSLKTGRFYGLIDKGISEHKHGKVHSLKAMHTLYNDQQAETQAS